MLSGRKSITSSAPSKQAISKNKLVVESSSNPVNSSSAAGKQASQQLKPDKSKTTENNSLAKSQQQEPSTSSSKIVKVQKQSRKSLMNKHTSNSKSRSDSVHPFGKHFKPLSRRRTDNAVVSSKKTEEAKQPETIEKQKGSERSAACSEEAFQSAASLVFRGERKDLLRSASSGCLSTTSQYFDIEPSRSSLSLTEATSQPLPATNDANAPQTAISLDRIFMEFHLSPALDGDNAESISAESIRLAFLQNSGFAVSSNAAIFKKPFPPNPEEWEKEFVQRDWLSCIRCCFPKRKRRSKRRRSKRRRAAKR